MKEGVSIRILSVTAYLPYPLNAGGRVRQYNLLKRLAPEHETTLVSFVDSEEELQYVPIIKEFCADVVTVLRKQPATSHRTKMQDRCIRLGRLVGAPLIKTPSGLVRSFDSPEMKGKIGSLLKTQSFDILQIDFTQMAGYLPESCTIPSILVEHDIMFKKHRRSIPMAHSPLVKAETLTDYFKVRRFELAACHKYHKIITMSEHDKVLLLEHGPDLDISVVPNGVNTAYFHPFDRRPDSKTLVFVGWMENPPNIDAVNYFNDQILPMITEQIPAARLRVIGKNPVKTLNLHTKAHNIEMMGYADDLRPYLADCAAFIVPLRIASGTRLKLLEAMAAGCPIVSTSIGAEGLEVTNLEHILIADDPREFAQAVVQLMRDTSLQNQLGNNAKALAQNKYDWEKIAQIQSRVYSEMGRRNEKQYVQPPAECFLPN